MHIKLIAVPYDSGHYDTRMGAGPGHLLRSGLADRLAQRGHRVDLDEVRLATDGFATEAAKVFDVQRRLAASVRNAAARGELPVVLAGNCSTSVGTVAGLRERVSEVVWLDAHADFNTPDTTVTGFLDGMALAMLTGRCWGGMTGTVEGFTPVDEASVYLVGARDIDAAEDAVLTASKVRRIPAAGAPGALESALGPARDDGIYLHLDLDVLDPREATINQFAAPAGLSRDDVIAVIRTAAECRRLEALAITAFDPAFDANGRATELVAEILESALAGGGAVNT